MAATEQTGCSPSFFDVVRTRSSVRAFLPKPVEPEKLRTILETANRAPSAGNLQAYQIVIVEGRQVLDQVAHAAFDQSFLADAPLALVFCADPTLSSVKYGKRGANLYCVQDATIACAYAQLAASALGLASAWVGAFDAAELGRVVGARERLLPVSILPIGHAAEKSEPSERRSLDDLVRRVGRTSEVPAR